MSTTYTYTMTITPYARYQPKPDLQEYCSSYYFVFMERVNCNGSSPSSFDMEANDVLNINIEFNPNRLRTQSAPCIEEAYLCSLTGVVLHDPENQDGTETDSTAGVKESKLNESFAVQGLHCGELTDMSADGTCLIFCQDLSQKVENLSVLPLNGTTTVGTITAQPGAPTSSVQIRLSGAALLKCQDQENKTVYNWLNFNHDPRLKFVTGTGGGS